MSRTARLRKSSEYNSGPLSVAPEHYSVNWRDAIVRAFPKRPKVSQTLCGATYRWAARLTRKKALVPGDYSGSTCLIEIMSLSLPRRFGNPHQ
jgi:hypothetical protein